MYHTVLQTNIVSTKYHVVNVKISFKIKVYKNIVSFLCLFIFCLNLLSLLIFIIYIVYSIFFKNTSVDQLLYSIKTFSSDQYSILSKYLSVDQLQYSFKIYFCSSITGFY